jgi:hypothetical protein
MWTAFGATAGGRSPCQRSRPAKLRAQDLTPASTRGQDLTLSVARRHKV